eukprot:gene9971-2290_t
MSDEHFQPVTEEIKVRHSVSDLDRKKFLSNSRISLDETTRSTSLFRNRSSLDFENRKRESANISLNITQPSSRIMQIFSPKRKVIHVRNMSRKSFERREEPQTPEFELQEKKSLDENSHTEEEEMEDLPELEEPEELSTTIGLNNKEDSFRTLSKNYRERFRLDPRFYFFLHLCWIIFVGIFGGTLVYLFELSNSRITFVDSIFTTFSAVTVTGLFVINFPVFLFSSKVVCLCCIILGTITLTNIPLMTFRCYEAWNRMCFLRRLHPEVVEAYKERVDNSPPPTDIEYLAYKNSIILLILVQATFQILSIFALGFWLTTYYAPEHLNDNDPLWISIFLTYSSWANAGFTLFPDNLTRFKLDLIINVIIYVMALCGNTLFPFIYRMVIEFAARIPSGNQVVYKFILDHHHRMTIHCFPSTQTKVYVIINFSLQLLGLFTFLIMEYGKDVLEGDVISKLTIALFHAGSTRTSGFNTIDLSKLSIVTLSIYILMMRIKPQMLCALNEREDEIHKIAHDDYRLEKIRRAAQEFEEQESRGYEIKPKNFDRGDSFIESTIESFKELTNRNFIKAFGESWLDALNTFISESISHLSEPNIWLGIVMILIAGFERIQLMEDNTNFTFFKIFFEVSSAFGNVGLSIGYPGISSSFSSVFSDASKILIIFVMIMGRHRGLFGAMEDQNVDFVIDM